MIRGNDFILNPDKLQEEFQLVEVSDWVDFSTKEKLGFYYTVLLPKLLFVPYQNPVIKIPCNVGETEAWSNPLSCYFL